MVQPSTAVEVVNEERGAIAAQRAIKPQLTEAAITSITYDLQMAEKLVTEALEEMVDYGQIPGVSGKGLWDPGASKIMNAFETYPRHKILYHEETDALITWALEVEIVHRASGTIVGAGVGACSTREPKYKYRWVLKEEAKRLGYSDPEIDSMKTKRRNEVLEYRVENPEYGEQVNTIMQMAAKRAETDAAKTLPGVASALRKLFDPKRTAGGSGARKAKEGDGEDSPRWTTFWNQMKGILGDGYQEKTHKILGVTSMKQWLEKGKSLDDATRFVIEQVKAGKVAGNMAPVRRDPTAVKETEVTDGETLEKVMEACYGWLPERVWAEANYASRKNFEEAGVETAWAVFCRLRDTIRQLTAE